MKKIQIKFEYANGRIEKVRLSYPMAIFTLQNILKNAGWPYIQAYIDEWPIEKQGRCLNVFESLNGKEIII